MSQAEMRFTSKQFDAEMFFVKRLGEHGRTVFAGITDPNERRERIRYAILEGKLDCAILGKNPKGRVETYAEAFERFYGEPLEPTSTHQPRKGTRNAQPRPA